MPDGRHHCIELELILRSNTMLNHSELDRQVPETIMTGETPNITHIVEVGWYEWVKFWDRAKFPQLKEVYSRWLGPAIDIGPALTSKILKSNGQVIYTSTYRTITEDEIHRKSEQDQQDIFDAEIRKKMGPRVREQDLVTF